MALDWQEKLFWSLDPVHTKPQCILLSGIVKLCGRSGLKLITPFGQGGGGGTPQSQIWYYLDWKRVHTLPILVWNRVRFSRKLRECINSGRFNIKWIRTKKYAISKNRRNDKHHFCLKTRSDNGYGFLRGQVWNEIFWSELGSGFQNLAGLYGYTDSYGRGLATSRFSRTKNSLSFPFKRLSRRLVQTSLRGSRLEGKGKGVLGAREVQSRQWN